MNEITAVIVVKDNPHHLKDCLDSIQDFVKTIIIADIGMSDEAKIIISKLKDVKIVSITEPSPYVEVIREELKKYVATDYLLFLDPDEIFPRALKQLLKEKIGFFDFAKIPRKNIIFGKWITHSRWWPDYQVRLFKKDKVTWPLKLHTQPGTSGKALVISPDEKLSLVHYNYEGLDDYFYKNIRYAKAEAAEIAKNNQSYALHDALKKSIGEFVSRFFRDNGYRDGMHGFALSMLQMFQALLVYLYYWENKKYFSLDEKTLINHSELFFSHGLKETWYWIIKKQLVGNLAKLKIKIVKKLF